MHIDRERGGGASLRELLLAKHVVLEVGAETAVRLRDDERRVPAFFHPGDVFDWKRVVAVVLARTDGEVGREFRSQTDQSKTLFGHACSGLVECSKLPGRRFRDRMPRLAGAKEATPAR